MIIGLTSPGQYGVSQLPAAWDLSVPSTLPRLLADPLLDRVYLLVARPWDPVSQAPATVYLANGSYQSFPADTPANQLFAPRLRSAYNCQFSLFSGSFDSPASPGFGDVQIINNDGGVDALTTYSWAGCAITVYLGSPVDPFSSFAPIFNGTAAGLTWNTQYINIQLADLQQLFARPLQRELFTPSSLYMSGSSYAASTTPFAMPAGSMCFECWVRPDATTSGQYDLVSVRNGLAAGLRRLDLSGGNLPRFGVRNDVGTGFSAQWATAIPAGSWHHLAGVLDVSAGFIYLYVDRVLVASTAITGTFTSVLLTNFTIGRQADTLTNYFLGRIGEIRVWSMARSLTEIGTNMYLSLSGAEANLVAYYSTREGSGSTVADLAIAVVGGPHPLTFTDASWAIGDWQPSAIVGKAKPLTYGQVRQRPAILVDPNAPGALIYQIHDRALQAVQTVFDSGTALTLGTDYTVDLARGYLSLLHSPAGAITVDAQGDNVGAGGYVSTPADIVRRIATRHGGLTDPGQINTLSFTHANAADPYARGYACDDSTTSIATALNDILRPLGRWVFDRLGLLFVTIFAPPASATATFTEDSLAKDAAGGTHINRLPTPDPSLRQRIGYHRIWLTQPPANLSASVSDADKQIFGAPYSFSATGEDLSVLTGYPLAKSIETLTLIDRSADAGAMSTLRQILFGQRQDIYQIELVGGVFQYWLSDTVQLTYREERPDLPPGVRRTRWDLTARLFVVIGIAEEVASVPGASDKITLTLWGLLPPAQLLIDTMTADVLLIDTDTQDTLQV